MRLPRLRIRRLMIVVAVVGILLAVVLPPIIACARWLHIHNTWISIGPFTLRF